MEVNAEYCRARFDRLENMVREIKAAPLLAKAAAAESAIGEMLELQRAMLHRLEKLEGE